MEFGIEPSLCAAPCCNVQQRDSLLLESGRSQPRVISKLFDCIGGHRRTQGDTVSVPQHQLPPVHLSLADHYLTGRTAAHAHHHRHGTVAHAALARHRPVKLVPGGETNVQAEAVFPRLSRVPRASDHVLRPHPLRNRCTQEKWYCYE